MTTVRASYWLVTINNPTDEDRHTLKSPPDYVKQLWYQDEIGEEGTLHIQLCANTTQIRFSQLKEWLGRGHIEAARNSAACKNYCKKKESSVPGTYVYWKQGAASTATEPELEPMARDLMYLMNNLPYNWREMDPEVVYQRTLSDILLTHPQLVNRLTQQRIRQNFDLCFSPFLENCVEIAENIDYPDPDGLDRQTECLIESGPPVPCSACTNGCPEYCDYKNHRPNYIY